MYLTIMWTLLTLTSAQAAPWESMTIQTQEGDTLLVEKKGRARYKFHLESGGKGDSIKCPQFFNVMRTALSLNLTAAGNRASGDAQMGSVLSYQDALSEMYSHPQLTTLIVTGTCVLGIDAFSGNVVLTMGNYQKNQGRTATLTADQTKRLGAFLQQ